MTDIYNAELIEVLNGSTIRMNIQINETQSEIKDIRLKGIESPNMQKNYRTAIFGASGVTAQLEVKKWLFEHSGDYEIQVDQVDICGRFLAILIDKLSADNLNDFMIAKIYKNSDWNDQEQTELKNDWYSGETVQIPGGDILPVFHIWGKSVFLGYQSSQFYMR